MDNPTVKLELTLDKVNILLGALAELPFRVSSELIKDIQTQATIQLNPPKASTEAE